MAEVHSTPASRSVVAIGIFDGLHRGHQEVLATVCREAIARQATATVVTFDPHPRAVLSPEHAPKLLSRLDQRLDGLRALGIERVVVIPFDQEAAQEEAESFVERVLIGELAACAVVAGDDTHFGHDRRGDLALLFEYANAGAFDVLASPTYGDNGRFSSSGVRDHLAAGDVAGATHILGHPFVLRGTVVHGDHRGRELGFPTANLDLNPTQALPALGIYAAAAYAQGAWRAAAVSVGTRPQFYDAGALLVEVHLPGFAGDLYGETLDVAFLARLRGEATFGSVDELLVQMARDVTATQELFQGFTPSALIC